jgi:hypothetical protein
METPLLVTELAADRQAEIARTTRQRARRAIEPRETFRHRAGRALIGLGRRLAADDL